MHIATVATQCALYYICHRLRPSGLLKRIETLDSVSNYYLNTLPLKISQSMVPLK